jgi:hypothetical protein
MATTATEERTGLERSQEKLLHGLRLIGAMIRATWEERGGEGLPAFFTGLSLPELNALHYATDILIEALPVLHKGFGTVMAEKASPENAPVLEYQPLSSLTLAELGVLLEESKDAKTIGFDLREIDPAVRPRPDRPRRGLLDARPAAGDHLSRGARHSAHGGQRARSGRPRLAGTYQAAEVNSNAGPHSGREPISIAASQRGTAPL